MTEQGTTLAERMQPRGLRYVLTRAEKTFCPECGKTPDLLATEDVLGSPAFYVCFRCEFVGQVGVGTVATRGSV